MSSNTNRKLNIGIIALDVVMMTLLVANLSLIIFDWLFLTEPVKKALLHFANSFYHFYNDKIHENFLTIDLAFVAVFLAELLVRWGIAVYKQTYHRWFFYPFVHWYDTLGCIPIASFRFFRIVRVISILYRLQRLSIIDLRNTYLFSVFSRYYAILIEEVSDRVIVNVLSGFQDELRRDNPVTDKIINEVFLPRKDVLTAWLVSRIRKVAAETYDMHKEDIQLYVGHLVGEAIKNNKEVKIIKQVPVVGGLISRSLEKAVADITLNTVSVAMKDLSEDKNNTFFQSISENMVEGLLSKEEKLDLNAAFKNVLLESLELIKQHVEIQQWKLRELEKQEAILREVLKEKSENTSPSKDDRFPTT